ncbi:HD domain-containing protein [Chryseobacterium sp. MYb328]|uniref:HD domain-containing protein n=1 Tax=Chryseobacterium sp. MYb328 TaxID=2745231 RepID=UPI0030A4460A
MRDQFEQLCFPFTKDLNLIDELWKEIETKYTEKGRHYHNLLHLGNMFAELEPSKNKISDFTAVSFSIFYHDIVYNATSKSNEEKSALKAKERLSELGLPQDTIEAVSDQILATKLHQTSMNEDTNYLLDADLSILGKDFESYLAYTKMIRKEYSIYPDLLYKPGRKKVLKHFLELDTIFKTDYFKDKYEMQAKKNIAAEIDLL